MRLFETILTGGAAASFGRRAFRIAAIAAAGVLLAGCPRDQMHNIVVNDGLQPISVAFTLRHPDERVGPPGICAVSREGNRLAPATDDWARDGGLGRRPIRWQRAAGQIEESEGCAFRADVPPGYGLLVATDQWCADYLEEAKARGLAADSIRPHVLSLTISTSGRQLHYVDWDAAKMFVRQASGHCLFRFR